MPNWTYPYIVHGNGERELCERWCVVGEAGEPDDNRILIMSIETRNVYTVVGKSEVATFVDVVPAWLAVTKEPHMLKSWYKTRVLLEAQGFDVSGLSGEAEVRRAIASGSKPNRKKPKRRKRGPGAG
jgi:hypothetical protein